jgi:hypothetical protein
MQMRSHAVWHQIVASVKLRAIKDRGKWFDFDLSSINLFICCTFFFMIINQIKWPQYPFPGVIAAQCYNVNGFAIWEVFLLIIITAVKNSKKKGKNATALGDLLWGWHYINLCMLNPVQLTWGKLWYDMVNHSSQLPTHSLIVSPARTYDNDNVLIRILCMFVSMHLIHAWT